jgi:hypothetical protein
MRTEMPTRSAHAAARQQRRPQARDVRPRPRAQARYRAVSGRARRRQPPAALGGVPRRRAAAGLGDAAAGGWDERRRYQGPRPPHRRRRSAAVHRPGPCGGGGSQGARVALAPHRRAGVPAPVRPRTAPARTRVACPPRPAGLRHAEAHTPRQSLPGSASVGQAVPAARHTAHGSSSCENRIRFMLPLTPTMRSFPL